MTALAVVIAVALTGLAGYLGTKVSLYENLDAELLLVANRTASGLGNNAAGIDTLDGASLQATNVSLALVRADGTVRRVKRDAISLQLSHEERALARLQTGTSARSGVDSRGQPYRIVAVPVQTLQGDYALVIGRSLDPTLNTLAALRAYLVTAGSIGVLLATLIGSLVARSALRPLRRLAASMRRTTETGDLEPIEVAGAGEITELTRSFNVMVTSLAASRDRQNQLVADASHELRTPLTSLRTNIELLVADHHSQMLPAQAREEIMVDVKAQLAEFTKLIGDLMHVSRWETAEALVPVPVDLSDVVNSAVERIRLRGPGIDFQLRIGPWFVMGEPETLQRAVLNLLDNAVKFAAPEGIVRIHLAQGRLHVCDSGTGITEEDLPRIFDRFFRSEKSRNTPGTGLGLAIVANAVARHGGTVSITNCTRLGGAEVRVDLPGAQSLVKLPASPGNPPRRV